MDPVLVSVIAIVVAAASECIALSPLKENSVAQILIEVLTKVFPKKKWDDWSIAAQAPSQTKGYWKA